MKKLLFVSLLFISFKLTAQDERRTLNGREYPIWYSRTKVLVKFKDPELAKSVLPERLAEEVKKVVLLVHPVLLNISDLQRGIYYLHATKSENSGEAV